jgi:MFS family permease
MDGQRQGTEVERTIEQSQGHARDLRSSVVDGCFWAAMVGFGEQFIPVLMLALHMGERATALSATVPAFIGAALTLVTPWAVKWVGGHKRWVVACAALQALTFVPLIIGALSGRMPVWIAFTVLGLYQFGGLAAGVAWSTWVSTLVGERERGRFFSFRNRMIWIAQLVSIFGAGWVLSTLGGDDAGAGAPGQPGQGGAPNPVLTGFALVLAVACVCRFVSTWLLSRISEPEPIPAGHRVVPLPELVDRLSHGPDARLMVYFFLVSFATNVSLGTLSPFVHGSASLAEPKSHWALVMGAMMLGRIAILFPLGDLLAKHGARATLMISATMIALVHALFLLTRPMGEVLDGVPGVIGRHPQLAWVVLVQFLAGMMYAANDLAGWLLLVRHTRPGERTSMIAVTWFGFWVFAALGGAVGTLILSGELVRGWQVLPGFVVQGVSPTTFSYEGYMWVFALGTGLRLLTLIPLYTWVRRLPDE